MCTSMYIHVYLYVQQRYNRDALKFIVSICMNVIIHVVYFIKVMYIMCTTFLTKHPGSLQRSRMLDWSRNFTVVTLKSRSCPINYHCSTPEIPNHLTLSISTCLREI